MNRPKHTYTHDEVTDAIVAGHRKGIAHRLHVSVSLVNKWTTDEGRGPLRQMVEFVEACRAEGCPLSEEAVKFVNERLGYLPPVHQSPEVSPFEPASVAEVLSGTGRFVVTVADAIADFEICREDARAIVKTASELMEAITKIRHAAEGVLRDEGGADLPTPAPIRSAGRQ